MKTTTTVTTIVDDFGAPGEATTVRFDHDGQTFEVDLNARNLATFHRRQARMYAPYIAVARVVGRTPADQLRTIREWAATNGHAINGRGWIPQDILNAYQAAHTDEAAGDE